VQTENEPYVISEHGWIVRVQPPRDRQAPPRTLLLIHGLTGDENVMWIFTRSLPGGLWMFAPRAPYPAEDGGYSWQEPGGRQGKPSEGHLPELEDLRDVCKRLLEGLAEWAQQTGAPVENIDVMGFSQGAAMAYALAAFYPERIGRVLALAGFAPKATTEPDPYAALKGKKIYIAHGSQDETVPVALARETVRMLQDIGADVTYCESEVGHKLSAQCLKGVEAFFAG
jgi:phospholipase/carboxylesterase